MAKVLITEGHLSDIADAIRAKLESAETYTPGEMAEAIMEIETGIIPTGTKQIAANGTHDVTQYASAAVQVPNTYVAADEGKVVSDGALVAQTGTTITQNGTYDTTENDEVTVNVSGGGYPEPTGSVSITENGTYDVKDVASAVVAVPSSEPVLQSKTAVRNGTVTPDAGYDGLSSVVVNVPSTGPIAPIIRCGITKGSMTQTLDLSSVNAEKLIVVAMNGDTDNKTLGTHVETLSSALTGTTLDYHQYSATGDNRMNYRIDAYDLSADADSLEISLTDGWVDEHTAFAWALISAGDFVIGKVMTTMEAATTGSNDRSGSVLFGTMNGSGVGASGGAAHSDSYHKGDTVATDDPGSGYMGSYIIWFAENGGGGGSTVDLKIGDVPAILSLPTDTPLGPLSSGSRDFIIPMDGNAEVKLDLTQPFEICCRFKLGTAPGSTGRNIWGSRNSYYHCPAIAVSSSTIVCYITTNGSSWDYSVNMNPSGYSLPIDTWITARMQWDGHDFTMSVNDGNDTYTATVANVAPYYNSNYTFEVAGQNRSAYSICASGATVDLANTYLSQNGTIIWGGG